MTTPPAAAVIQLVQRLRDSGMADVVRLGLAGTEPLWPFFAESLRLLTLFSQPPHSADWVSWLTEPQHYADLLRQLGDDPVLEGIPMPESEPLAYKND